MASVRLKNVSMFFGQNQVLHDIDLNITQGEFVVMVGPSGCGKSTLLRIIAGLEQPDTGDIWIDDKRVNDVSPADRDITMVFQTYALYPHMSVHDNLAFSLEVHHIDEATREARVNSAAAFLQLTDYLDRLPAALSGGQRQRVAIGRAIVRQPGVFLFDEPLSNLDAALRLEMRLKIKELNDELPDSTMIYVTHDQIEAMTLADRIVVLSSDGGIEQIGTPVDLYLHPANLFVARFIGSPAMNVLPARVVATGDSTQISTHELTNCVVPVTTSASWQNKEVLFGVRPEDLRLASDDEPAIGGQIAHIEQLGEYSLLYVEIAVGEPWVIAKLPGHTMLLKGETVRLTMSRERLYLFDMNGVSPSD